MRQIDPHTLTCAPFAMFDDDWALLTAGDDKSCNTMTVSWGGMGILWGMPVTFVVVRPTRHTYGFIESLDRYTLTFFKGEEKRAALNLCGSKSGRDMDKIAAAGLRPVYGEGVTWFEDAAQVYICRKLYCQDIAPANMLDPAIDRNYPAKDYHRMYIGEIENLLVAD